MDTDALLALLAFALVTTGTPGPNNLMVMASGANFGLRRTAPHILGIAIGVAVMILTIGAGLSRLFEAVPWLLPILRVVAVTYLLFLAWKIATAAPPDAAAAPGRPMSFLQAALFQWVNPKAWAMALTTVSVYAAPSEAPLAALVFAAIALPVVSAWTLAGAGLGRILAEPRRLRWFNRAMALLLVASTLPTLA